MVYSVVQMAPGAVLVAQRQFLGVHSAILLVHQVVLVDLYIESSAGDS